MTRQDQDAELEPIANRLHDERPVPPAGFRAELRGRLLEVRRRRRAPSQRVRLLVAVYAGSGLALLAIAAIGASGGGPLAAS